MRLGIDLGGTAIKSGLVDDAGQVLFYETLPTNASGGADAVLDALTDACRRQLARAAVAAVGIGMPGTVDEARGVLVRAANLPLADYPLTQALSRRLGIPAYLGNDANCALYGEIYAGAGRESDNFLLVTVGTGIGGGIRIGGQGRHRTAMTVAGERKYRDFRKDNTLDTRQFQMAFRLLRQLSVQADSSEKVLDVDGTIRDTCDNAGTLKVRYKNPRKNAVKVLLLMDSGGSMDYYAGLCSMLFQAATKSNNFKELHTYYFHNCVYSEVYTHPGLRWDSVVPTEWLLQNYDASYKVIIVGDGAMSPYELREPRYDWEKRTYGDSGLAWFERLRRHYPYLIWLNPEPMPARPDYWSQTHWQLAQIFHMYDLSAEGLEQGMKRLMVRR